MRHDAEDERRPAIGSAVVNPSDGTAIPPGFTAKQLTETWQPDGAGGGIMTGELAGPNGEVLQYAAAMEKQDGIWRVVGTVETTGTVEGSADSRPL